MVLCNHNSLECFENDHLIATINFHNTPLGVVFITANSFNVELCRLIAQHIYDYDKSKCVIKFAMSDVHKDVWLAIYR